MRAPRIFGHFYSSKMALQPLATISSPSDTGFVQRRWCRCSASIPPHVFQEPVPEDLKFRHGGVSVDAISMEKPCKQLFNHIITLQKKLAIVQGAPGSGKTSLSNAFANHLKSKGYVPIHVGSRLKSPRKYIKKAKTTASKAVLIVDDAHNMFAKTYFADMYFKDRPYYVVCFCTSSDINFLGEAQVMRPHIMWYHGPTSDRVAIEGYTKRMLVGMRKDPKLYSSVTSSLYDYCGAHMDVTVSTLLSSVKKGNKKGQLPKISDVLNGDSPPRALSHKWGVAHRALASRLLASGTLFSDDISGVAEEKLLRKGFVVPIRPDGNTTLMKCDWRIKDVAWAHTWQINAARVQNVKPQRTEPVNVKATSPLELLINMLPYFPQETFFGSAISKPTTSGSSSSTIEYLQEAVGAALTAAGFDYRTVSTREKKKKKTNKSDARIDFVVNLGYGTKWGVKLVQDSSGIEEAAKRFGKRGTCLAGEELNDSIVVDCRTKPLSMGAKASKKVVTIAPHALRGWDVIVVHDGRHNKTYNVPRDCVPRVLNDDSDSVELAQKRTRPQVSYRSPYYLAELLELRREQNSRDSAVEDHRLPHDSRASSSVPSEDH